VGLAAAAANGRKGGRPRKVDDADAAKARALREKGITATDIAKMLGVSRPPCTATFPMAFRKLRDSWCPPHRGDHLAHRQQRTAAGRSRRMKADGRTGKDIAKYLGVSRATLYRYLSDTAA